MDRDKICIDIGGTKTLFALVGRDLEIKRSFRILTPHELKDFKRELIHGIDCLRSNSTTANVSIAGRVDLKGRVVLSPALPLIGFNLKKELKKKFVSVNIDNDANCFAAHEIVAGNLKNVGSGVIVVWGTGVGGCIVANRRIYRGMGFAAELGHLQLLDRDEGDVETLIAGKNMVKNYGHSGKDLQAMAEKGDAYALDTFKKIGTIFGKYLASLMFALDPEVFVLGGSFVKSWDYMSGAAEAEISRLTVRKKAVIKVIKDDFYVIKGCYFLDDYEKLSSKL